MEKITGKSGVCYHWECPIDKEYHRQSVKTGFYVLLLLCAAVIIIYLIASRSTDRQTDFWIPLLVIGVILAVALPLLLLMNSADAPHEEYFMTEEYVKAGYGKGALFARFKKTAEVTVTEKYIEMSGGYRTVRVYVPEEDMPFVRDYILERIPDSAVIRHR